MLLVTLVYGWFIATVMPAQSAISLTYAGEWGAPDGHFFYTPDVLYEQLKQWSDFGRNDYIRFRLSMDILWALAYTAWLIATISCALRLSGAHLSKWGNLNLLPLITMGADYIENGLGIVLVNALPERLDGIAWIVAGFTAFKWSSLALSHIVLITALAVALWQKTKQR